MNAHTHMHRKPHFTNHTHSPNWPPWLITRAVIIQKALPSSIKKSTHFSAAWIKKPFRFPLLQQLLSQYLLNRQVSRGPQSDCLHSPFIFQLPVELQETVRRGQNTSRVVQSCELVGIFQPVASDSSDPEQSDHSQAVWPRGSRRSEPSTQAVIWRGREQRQREEVNTSREQRYTETAWFSMKEWSVSACSKTDASLGVCVCERERERERERESVSACVQTTPTSSCHCL